MTPTSGIEFLVWLLIVAAMIAMLAKRLRIPYTVSLVLGGLLLGIIQLPILSPLQPGHRPDWLTPDVILILFLPALVFEGSVKLDVRELLRNSVPLLLLANAGVQIGRASCRVRVWKSVDDVTVNVDRWDMAPFMGRGF